MGVDRDYPLHRYFLWAKQLELTLGGATPQLLKLGEILADGAVPERVARALVVEHDGLRIAALDWGGDGEPLLLLHPNGFCAGFFDPLARRLRDAFRPVAVDLRGHGGTDTPAGRRRLRVPAHGRRRPRGARPPRDRQCSRARSVARRWRHGARRRAPARPAAPPAALRGDRLLARRRWPAAAPGRGPATAATSWPRSPASAGPSGPTATTVLASYRSRPPFDVLAPESLAAYVRWGFVDRADGQVELACSPEVEATIFEVSARASGRAGGLAPPRRPDARRDRRPRRATATCPSDWFALQADACRGRRSSRCPAATSSCRRTRPAPRTSSATN